MYYLEQPHTLFVTFEFVYCRYSKYRWISKSHRFNWFCSDLRSSQYTNTKHQESLIMTLSTKNIIFIISSYILLTNLAAPAYAGGYSLGYGYNGHSSHYSAGYGHHSYGGHYNYGRHSYSKNYFNYGHHNSYGHQEYSYPRYRSNQYNSYKNSSSYNKPCHDVFKTTVDEYGQYQKIGGTMCYNSHGQGYVVSGSRYLVK